LWKHYLKVNARYSEIDGQIQSKIESMSGLSRRTKDKEKERDAAEVELSKLNLSRLDERERHLVFIQLAQISYLGVWASLLVNLSCSVKNLSKCHVGSTQSRM